MITPSALQPPMAPFTDQSNSGEEVPDTVALNAAFVPARRLPVGPVIEMVASRGGIVREPDREPHPIKRQQAEKHKTP